MLAGIPPTTTTFIWSSKWVISALCVQIWDGHVWGLYIMLFDDSLSLSLSQEFELFTWNAKNINCLTAVWNMIQSRLLNVSYCLSQWQMRGGKECQPTFNSVSYPSNTLTPQHPRDFLWIFRWDCTINFIFFIHTRPPTRLTCQKKCTWKLVTFINH